MMARFLAPEFGDRCGNPAWVPGAGWDTTAAGASSCTSGRRGRTRLQGATLRLIS